MAEFMPVVPFLETLGDCISKDLKICVKFCITHCASCKQILDAFLCLPRHGNKFRGAGRDAGFKKDFFFF